MRRARSICVQAVTALYEWVLGISWWCQSLRPIYADIGIAAAGSRNNVAAVSLHTLQPTNPGAITSKPNDNDPLATGQLGQ